MAKSDKITPKRAIPWKEIFTFLGVLLTAFIGYLGIRAQYLIPIEATQTAEARLTTISATSNMMTQSAIAPSATPIVAYVILDKDDTFSGASLRIDLGDCGRVDIKKDSTLHDSTSSFILFAPNNVEIVLVQHQTSHGDYPGNTGRWQGNNDSLRVNINELKASGVHDNVSSIQWLVEGKLLNDRICQVD